MLNEVSEMIGHHGQVFRKWEQQHDMMFSSTVFYWSTHDDDNDDDEADKMFNKPLKVFLWTREWLN